MYRIPDDLDLSPAVGESATQVHVGQFDLQFTFGPVHLAVQSMVQLFRGGEPIARWEEGRWPDPGFLEVMNTPIVRWAVVGDRRIVIEFENGIAMHLVDDSDAYECMRITTGEDGWII